MSHVGEGQSISSCKCHTDTTKHKIKRLRSRKERSQTRCVGCSKDVYKAVKTYQYHRCHQGSLDIGHLHSCCHHSQRGNITPPPLSDSHVPTQEASIITTARLIGHRGLFNREVKSVDIERLLLGKKEKKVKEKNVVAKKDKKAKATSLFVRSDTSGPDEEAQATETHQGRDKKIQASGVTPDQKEQDHSSFTTSAEAPAEKGRKVRPREKPPYFAELTPMMKNPPDPHRPPSPVICQTVAVEIEHDSHAQRGGVAPKSIRAVAERLCEALHFPLMKKRDLVAESREVLFCVLRETHRQHLQKNILSIQSGKGLHRHARRAVRKPKDSKKGQDRRRIPDAFPASFQIHSADPFYLNNEEASVLENTKKVRKHVSWDFSPPPQQHLDQPTAWPSPKDISAGFLEDIFRPCASPEFSMDFDCSSSNPSFAVTHRLFAPSPVWQAEPLAQRFGKTPTAVDPFEDCFVRGEGQSQVSGRRHGPHQELRGRYSLQHFPQPQNTLIENQPSFTFPSHMLTSLHGHHFPPSFFLESPPPPFTSLSSPKHWPFGSRKLY
ncbi:triadin isoform X2 [Syngnathoides biaculeatus]|nr:triadin isoform X2 [Syngnathoides biaculeatus]XP_061674940.1 triadin isoform X2 [Syngnathoides biaculeatus]